MKSTTLPTSIKKDAVNGQVPVHIGDMVLVDMRPPSHKVMIAFVHNEHLARKRSKVFVLY